MSAPAAERVVCPEELPVAARRRLDELGPRAVLADMYDDIGSPVYDDLARGDTNEVRELLSAVRRTPGPVLELAAGSGRLTMPLLALGRSVTALELSGGMLAILRERLAAAPRRLRELCTPVQGDMSRFDLGTRFGVVVLGTTSISLLDDTGRRSALATIARHLAPGGRLLVSTAHLTDRDAPPAQQYEIVGGSGRSYRMYEHVDPSAGVRAVAVFGPDDGTGPVPVCASVVRVIDPDRLERELAEHGLVVHARHPVRMGGGRYSDVLLEAGAEETS